MTNETAKTIETAAFIGASNSDFRGPAVGGEDAAHGETGAEGLQLN